MMLMTMSIGLDGSRISNVDSRLLVFASSTGVELGRASLHIMVTVLSGRQIAHDR